jgi:hypothetical protein
MGGDPQKYSCVPICMGSQKTYVASFEVTQATPTDRASLESFTLERGRDLGGIIQFPGLYTRPFPALIKKKTKFSSYIRKLIWDRLQSYI